GAPVASVAAPGRAAARARAVGGRRRVRAGGGAGRGVRARAATATRVVGAGPGGDRGPRSARGLVSRAPAGRPAARPDIAPRAMEQSRRAGSRTGLSRRRAGGAALRDTLAPVRDRRWALGDRGPGALGAARAATPGV